MNKTEKTVLLIIVSTLLLSKGLETYFSFRKPHTTQGQGYYQHAEIIVPDDYKKIQWAINNASDGDTIFVRAGTYYEHVNITKSLSLIGENRNTTIIDGNSTGTVVRLTANAVTIEGFTVQNGGMEDIGILLCNSNNSVIQRNVVKQHSFGIFVDRSNNCQISGNIAKDGDFGIFVVNSRNCTVGDNTIRARVTDIRLGNSCYCVVINNTANCYGHGIYLSDSPNCVVSDNTAVKTSGFSDGNCITLDNSDNCIVSGNTANKNTYGIFLAGSSNVTISNNTANNNKSGGIELEKSFVFHEPKEPSNNCTIVNNIAISNDVGIYLSSSQHSIVRNNIANNNWWWGIAILWGSNNCIISDNTVNNNPWGSIIAGSYECKFSNNTVSNNEHGLELAECSDNHIYNNNLINNTNQVFLRETYNNTLYHNNFINSTSQVYDWAWDNQEISLSINTWDDGYPSGGNYWSDYNGTDANHDGIGDTPYIIDTNNTDRYPLMHPWSSLPVHNINTGSGYTTIQEAIDASETLEGHVIFVDAGTYYENLNIAKSISLIGENKHDTIIDGEYWRRMQSVVIWVYTNSVSISGFTIRGGKMHGVEVTQFTSGNNISYNIITNNEDGIYISHSSNNIIMGNIIVDNMDDGLFLWYSNNNTIIGNTFSNNTYAVDLQVSNDNKIIHNNFINNTNQVLSVVSTNVWDDGYPSGGNYWSDYTDVDQYSGPYQNETGSDGIWDHPYEISYMNQDNYPIVPEFPTWTSMLLILLVLTVPIAIYKRRLLKTPIH